MMSGCSVSGFVTAVDVAVLVAVELHVDDAEDCAVEEAVVVWVV